MSDTPCPICQLSNTARANLDGLSRAAAAAAAGTTEWAVRAHRAGQHDTDGPPAPTPPAAPKAKPAQAASVELGATEGVINTGPMDKPLADPSDALRLLNVDPDQWQLVGDTVRISRWETPYRDETGEMVSRWNHALRARIERRPHLDDLALPIEQWRAQLLAAKPVTPRTPGTATTYVICVADPQLGKKGTQAAVANWQRAVAGHLNKVRVLCATGQAPAAIHVAFMGDEHEGVVNSYTNQPHTVELNRSEQLELDFDMRVWTIREALSLGLPVSASSVISNHGEYTRNGGKDPVTSRNDNSSTLVARQVRRLFDELEPHTRQHVEWTIGDGAPGVTVVLSGEKVYFTHGYVEKGRGGSTELRAKSAIERQVLGNTAEYGPIRVFVWAHYHHHYVLTFEGRTVLGCPALEAEKSSEYMLDQFGVWSVPGALGFVVGEGLPMGWNDAAIC